MKKLNQILLLVVFCATSTIGLSQEDSLENLQKEWGETVDALTQYSAEQRDEAVQSTRVAMDKLDREIDRLEGVSRDRWQSMSAEAREAQLNAMQDLRALRNDASEWYGVMKYSTADNWEDAKSGFISTYNSITDSIGKSLSN